MSAKIRILYIDDYELDRELVRDSLEKEHGGFELMEASNKQEYETLLRNHEFDLVLSDFNIAGFEGLQVIEAVRVHNPRIPVIIVTGTGSEEVAAQALKQGAADYVIKRPKHIQRLPQTIFAAIEKKILKEQHEKAEAALMESEAKYRRIFENSVVGLFQSTPEGRFLTVNPAFAELFGYESPDELISQITDIANQYYANPEDRRRYKQLLQKAGTVTNFEFKAKRKDGSLIWVSHSTRACFNQDGKVDHYEGIVIDISKRMRAEEEREKLQAQLIQAQKMEAVGRLAGGVAHDFNNKLGVIIGHAELTMERMDPSSEPYADLKEIHEAALRSADLTRQLLAFARKQNVIPEILDVNDTVTGMLKMLRRLIGEDIDLAWMPGADLWLVKIDPAQIDQILANLCVNARDAIGGVGKITIETQNVVIDEAYCADHAGFIPGAYVMLAVSDDGSGMDKETLENLFEPFFTTKKAGEGIGLGLATVYGIVKQNDGFINVYSEPEKGTTFKIYMPRTKETMPEKGESVTQTIAKGTETVLLVEDEGAILRLSKKILERLGYTVLAVSTTTEALAMAEGYEGQIHILITDVVMPEMNGKELAERVEKLQPLVKVLFMSGYTANVIVHRGILKERVHFLQKPFSVNAMAAKVRKVLDVAG